MNSYLSFKNRIKHINSDLVGAISAFLCIIHCAIVPILMGLHSFYYAGEVLVSTSHTHPSSTHFSDSLDSMGIFENVHWHSLDYFFVVITLVAVFFATRKSIVFWISTGLWSCAILFVVSILLEDTIHGIEYLAYLASALLIVFHLLNQRLGKNIRSKYDNLPTTELNLEKASFDIVNLETEVQPKKENRVTCMC